MANLATSLLPALCLGAGGFPHDPPPRPTLSILPAVITLDGARDQERFVVLRSGPNGVTHDVTAAAKLSFTRPGIARLLPAGRLQGVADGETELVARAGGLAARIPVRVRDVSQRTRPSFRNDVIPVLTRAGCNQGSCHGAAAGKNGFRLSLFGYDPAHDHRALTRELRGRRLELAEPEASLMLLKPTRKVPHKGGKRLEPGGSMYETLRAWIAAGAPDDPADAPRLQGIEIFPDEALLAGEGARLQVVVRGRYSDGTDRDVTDLALWSASNEAAAGVDAHGVVTAKGSGESYVMARYGSFAVVSQILVIPNEAPFTWPEDAVARNYIDEAIHRKLRRMRIAPAGVCDDATFLRRAYLDILGVLPQPEETRRFLADRRPDKRARLVDALLERPEFAMVQAMQWSEALRIESRRLERKGMVLYTEFLREAFQSRRPFDQVVRELLTAQGSNFSNPAVNFYMVERQPQQTAEMVAQVFLGVRIQCAQCHNHPFERWTMDDYYGFAAFFAQVGRKRGELPYETIVYHRGNGEVRNRRNGRVAAPRFLGGGEPRIERGKDRRAVLAAWLTDAENPWFAANVANRVFARFFGRGLVDPPDDVRVSNPPSHPRLHRLLGAKLVEYGYDVARLVRDLCASRTYQLRAHPDPLAQRSFAGAAVRRLSAEQLLDAIAHVTGVPEKYPGLPLGARATQVADGDPRKRFLDLFGRPRRTSSCTCERRSEPTLGQVLHLINGATIQAKLRSEGGRLRRLLRAGAGPEAILEELYLAAYCRYPKPEEKARLLAVVEKGGGKPEVWEDIFWAVLNSREFVFQH